MYDQRPEGPPACDIRQSDAIDLLRSLPGEVDLVFGSPPYEDARSYGGLPARQGQAWVDWMVEVTRAASEKCRGLVAWVVAGRTRQYKWSATPALLAADLHRAGFNLRNPPIFRRVGIPGSGGPDWLRSDYEWVVCVSRPGRLPWSDNTACGHPPKWKNGGPMSNRQANDARVGDTPRYGLILRLGAAGQPDRANPGSVISCVVGGGKMGHSLAHDTEAPFPLTLAEFFVKSFCPPGGVVCDPFVGSGTTAHAALLHGRKFVGGDVRESQVELTRRRLADVFPPA
jgi:hypothetical protein